MGKTHRNTNNSTRKFPYKQPKTLQNYKEEARAIDQLNEAGYTETSRLRQRSKNSNLLPDAWEDRGIGCLEEIKYKK